MFSNIFYFLINRFSDIEIKSGVRDYRLMTRRMVNSILTLKEKNRFSKGLFAWTGYKTRYLEYKNIKRAKGKTKWSFWKLLRYSLDGITAFSVIPLQFATIIGFLFCFLSFFAVLYFVALKLVVGNPIKGYTMLICAIFLLGGIQLLCMGILGQYLGKLFFEEKHRPDYVIQESNFPANGFTENAEYEDAIAK